MIESSEHAFLVLYRLKDYTVDPLSYTTSKEFKLSSFSLPPVSSIDPSKMIYKDIGDKEVKARVEKVLQDPNAVVISTTIN